ncbi:hypothetical protein Lfu02_49620 [Longispora fulva]|uniref:SAM-dependent methyltransferase n=1 Tax=Longispora fulva TaxID=619741 RepID=A0A8J7GK72_9ACTN|nr:hypothetical protein [Longispora fulva]MBG6138337.1 SAM-dependent methyltransferase [Longispora fulva]GIG60590.1 hypothetical protein Lfu02_49620 [Longispora fulva]
MQTQHAPVEDGHLPRDLSTAVRDLMVAFYSTARAGADLLSDGGGPFGFDIQVAMQMAHLIDSYPVDRIVETGCCRGDTTEFIARAWPDIEVVTCDIDTEHAEFTRLRCRDLPNVTVHTGDSADLIGLLLDGANCPLVYLDAHWRPAWPLGQELAAVRRGVVAIDDFDIGHPRFGFDTYAGLTCGRDAIGQFLPDIAKAFVGDPFADYPAPCLQVGRRTGTCYIPFGVEDAPLRSSGYFRALDLSTGQPICWPDQIGGALR